MSAGIVAGSRIFLPVPSSTQPAQGQRSRRRAAGTLIAGPPGHATRTSPLAATSIASGGATSCFLKAILSRSPMATFLCPGRPLASSGSGERREDVRAVLERRETRARVGDVELGGGERGREAQDGRGARPVGRVAVDAGRALGGRGVDGEELG